MHHAPKKSLGQNFLTSEPILKKIIAEASLVKTDTVLEIGPGKGALTKHLIASGCTTLAIEKDDALFEYLTTTYNNPRITFIHQDILEFDPETIKQPYKIVANIPYNITGAILEKFLSSAHQPTKMVLLVQKEVAQRICAQDRTTGKPDKESILSLSIKAYGTPRYAFTVKAGSFFPAPKVDSAVIVIDTISRKSFINKHHEEVFFQVVKAGFAHKRKILAGNLKNILEPFIVEEIFSKMNLDTATRAEDLGISQWISLATLVYNEQYGL